MTDTDIICKEHCGEVSAKKNKPKYSYNRDYFEEIDTHPKAYFLGFIIGDGHIRGHPKDRNKPQTLSFRIAEKDEDILYSFIEEIGGDSAQIKKDNRKIRGKMNRAKTLEISSFKLVNDLIRHGVLFKDKSKKQKWVNVSKEYEVDLIRGLLDSDGWISLREEKGSFYIDLGFCGTEDLVRNFSQWFEDTLDIKLNVHERKNNFFETRIKTTDLDVIERIYNKLYPKNGIPYLSRKRDNLIKIKELVYEKHRVEVSFNDCNELSLLIPILGCNKRCPYCYNHDYLRNSQMCTSKIQEEILKKTEIKTLVFGGNDPIGRNFDVVKDICAKFSKHKKVFQIGDISLHKFKKLLQIAPDFISLTLNNITGEQKIRYLKKCLKQFNVETKVVYIPGRTMYPKEFSVDVVQQFIPGECLDPKYNKIAKPTRDDVLRFAKKIEAREIITQENGREEI